MKWVTVVEQDESGECCTASVQIPMDQEPPANSELGQFVVNNDCPPDGPGLAPAAGTPTADPQQIACDVWTERSRPQPRPEIPPGNMIVGIPAYLVSNATMTDELDEDTAAGPLSATATSELWVDRGDASGMTGPYTDAGAPHPHGTIAHVYQHHGTYDVTVVQRWHVAWSYDDASGSFYQDAPPVVIEDHPVREIQAVLG